MTDEEKKAYVAKTKTSMKAAICAKLAEIRAMVAAEAKPMAECGGADAAELILCAVDCTCDQVAGALAAWEAPAGEKPSEAGA